MGRVLQQNTHTHKHKIIWGAQFSSPLIAIDVHFEWHQ